MCFLIILDKMILGIETSCDETAVAVVDGSLSVDRRVIVQKILSQTEQHKDFGGVVPEIAARAHLQYLDRLIAEVLRCGHLHFGDFSGIAVTAGPGLIGGVNVGVMMAKSIAYVHALPFIAVNHLEGHALTVRLCGEVEFPYLLLLISGGHCQLLLVRSVGYYDKLGETRDDAVGEAFDKVAKLLGLAYPGGVSVEREAGQGDADAYDLPRPLAGDKSCDFSLSGLKSAVRRLVLRQKEAFGEVLSRRFVADLCASFQRAVGDILCERVGNSFVRSGGYFDAGAKPRLVVAGGVAANIYLRRRLHALCDSEGWQFIVPPPPLCTDNGAMIAWAGYERLALGWRDGLDFAPRPRWNLEDLGSLESLSA